MDHKFRIWQDGKMLMPEDVTKNTLGHRFEEKMQKLLKEQRERFMDPGREAAIE